MSQEDDLGKLERMLCEATEGMCYLQKALVVAKVLREAFGGEWVIRALPDGDYMVERKSQ